MIYLYDTFIYFPLYNLFSYLLDYVTFGSAGLAIIAITIIVKLVLFRSTKKSIIMQKKMAGLKDELAEIKEKYKSDSQTQALKTLEIYKKNGISPFSGLAGLFIQIPIFFGLYSVISNLIKDGVPTIDSSILYSFVPKPEVIDMIFLGINLGANKNIFVAILVGVLQYYQIKLSLPDKKKVDPNKTKSTPDFATQMADSMQFQMKYFIPLLIAFTSFTFGNSISLYFIASSIFIICQEIYLKKTGVK